MVNNDTDGYLTDDFMENENNDCKETNFSWNVYLKETNSEVVPHSYFQHVYKSTDSVLEPGMKVEILYRENKKEKYWVATVISCLGPVVRLRYLGDEENSQRELWEMEANFKPHPLGWCKKCKLLLTPPAHLSHINVEEALKAIENEKTVDDDVLQELDQFVPGIKIELEDEYRPYKVWMASILDNFGGRLQIRYDTPNSKENTFWLYHTSPRIHPYGWAKSQGTPWSLEKPSHISKEGHSDSEWAALYEMNMFNFEIEYGISQIGNYKYRGPQVKHDFQVGMKLEAIDPTTQTNISPATIAEVIDSYYFLVQIDNTETKFVATIDSANIFPVGWSSFHGIQLYTPNIQPFCWKTYLSNTNSQPAVFTKQSQSSTEYSKLIPGMKLEAVNPADKNQICVGTIVSLHDELVRIRLELDELEDEELKKTHKDESVEDKRGTDVGESMEIELDGTNVNKGFNEDQIKQKEINDGQKDKIKIGDKNQSEISNSDKDLGTSDQIRKGKNQNKEDKSVGSQQNKKEDGQSRLYDSDANFQQKINGDQFEKLKTSENEPKSYLFSFKNCELFPAGWCQTNSYMLTVPKYFSMIYKCPGQRLPLIQNNNLFNKDDSNEIYRKIKIYVNYKCFSGPLLSKSKLAALPKYIGPGQVKLVFLDLIKRIANLAYAQMRILRELEASDKIPNGRIKEELTVKYKTKVYKGFVEIPTNIGKDLDEYCKEMCVKLQTCPNLFSRKLITECPLNCLEKMKINNNKSKKNKDKQGYDYRSFLYKPNYNPILFINRQPFQEDVLIKEDTFRDVSTIWNKCLRKRKVNVYLEREKKRLKINNDEETGSSKGKDSENSEEDDTKRKRANKKANSVEEARTKRNNQIETCDKPVKENKTIETMMKTVYLTKFRLPKGSPMDWSADDVFGCISQSNELKELAELLRREEFDGQSLMMIDYPLCIEYLKLNTSYAILLCEFVEKVLFLFINSHSNVHM